MNIWSKIFGSAGMEVADKVSEVVDKFVETPDEKKEFKKQMMQVFADSVADEQKNVTERWKADLEHGNWLTRSVRPLVLVFLIISTVIMVFVDSGSITFNVEQKWTDLLQLVLMTTIGAYFGGRSVEKFNQFKNK